MFKSSTEGINSLAVDDVARQAVPKSGTSSTESSITNSPVLLVHTAIKDLDLTIAGLDASLNASNGSY